MRKGQIRFFLFIYAYIVAYMCFQGELSSLDEKDSFYEELKEEYRSNNALREPTGRDVRTHDHAAVTNATHVRTATTHDRAYDRAPAHSRPWSVHGHVQGRVARLNRFFDDSLGHLSLFLFFPLQRALQRGSFKVSSEAFPLLLFGLNLQD